MMPDDGATRPNLVSGELFLGYRSTSPCIPPEAHPIMAPTSFDVSLHTSGEVGKEQCEHGTQRNSSNGRGIREDADLTQSSIGGCPIFRD